MPHFRSDAATSALPRTPCLKGLAGFMACLGSSAALCLAGPAAQAQTQAQTPAAPASARVVQVQGEASVGGAPALPGMPLAAAATELRTGATGRLQLLLADGSVLALPPASRLSLSGTSRQLTLDTGGLTLNASGGEWRIDLPGRSLRTRGFLVLHDCGAGCALAPGLYGRIAGGEAVLEYQGGRAVLRSRSFRWPDAQTRPESLAREPALLADATELQAAAAARTSVAEQLKAGIQAFNDGRDDEAVQALQAVQQAAPAESLVPYYLGLIALRRQDNPQAIALLQRYAAEDPEGAAARGVPQTLTLLSSAQLQNEVATAVARESQVAATPPEPGSIAVQAFVNHGNEAYRAMAKGLAAMIIADLGKVPNLKVLEREKVQLLVDEAKLGDSGLADTASAVRSGRLMRAEKVVVGNFEVQQ